MYVAVLLYMKLIFLSFISIFFLASSGYAMGPQFTYEDLITVIQEKKLNSIEAVLSHLPREMLSNFTLMQDSLSLQKADPLHPRAILFGTDAKLVCSFGGNPQLAGYDSLECYQYRDSSRSFDFREIVFPSAANGLQSPAFSAPTRQ